MSNKKITILGIETSCDPSIKFCELINWQSASPIKNVAVRHARTARSK